MKVLLLLVVCLPLIAICQKPTVISYNRYFPKNDKVIEFEKGLKEHAAKYHTGQWKWRVYTIESGPDAGGYLVIEGPMTWDGIDKRGTLGTEHMHDFYRNVSPHMMDKSVIGYLSFREDLSSVDLTDFSDKIAINHIYPNPGKAMAVEASIAKWKKVWEEGKQSMAVYESNTSGPVEYNIVTRYKQGLKEKEAGFRKPAVERYEAVNGSGSHSAFMNTLVTDLQRQWSELAFYSEELSSK